MELIADCYWEEKGELDRDSRTADKGDDGAAETRIQPSNTGNCPECKRPRRARGIGDHRLRRAGAGRERVGEAFSVKPAHRPAKNVRTRSLPQAPRDLDIEELEMRSALQFDATATEVVAIIGGDDQTATRRSIKGHEPRH